MMVESAISIDIGWQSKAVIGRFDPQTRRAPDISLDCLNAHENGVSRRHAVLIWRNDVLHIIDLGSANGTWVNGLRLFPHQPHGLHHGDTIQMGRVQLRLQFHPKENYPPVFIATMRDVTH